MLKLPMEDLLLFISILRYLTAKGVVDENQSLFEPVVPVLMYIVHHCMRSILEGETTYVSKPDNSLVNPHDDDTSGPFSRDTLYNVLYVLEGMCFFNDVMVPVISPCFSHPQNFLAHGLYSTLATFIYNPVLYRDRAALSYAVNIITYSVFNAREKNVSSSNFHQP